MNTHTHTHTHTKESSQKDVPLDWSLLAPPNALKAPWTCCTCNCVVWQWFLHVYFTLSIFLIPPGRACGPPTWSFSPKASLWMMWVISGLWGWAVALCVDTWKFPGTYRKSYRHQIDNFLSLERRLFIWRQKNSFHSVSMWIWWKDTNDTPDSF